MQEMVGTLALGGRCSRLRGADAWVMQTARNHVMAERHVISQFRQLH